MDAMTGAAVSLDPAAEVSGRWADASGDRASDAGTAAPADKAASVRQDGALRVTVLTATRPSGLSKRFALQADGTLEKKPGGVLVEGEASVHTLRDLAEFAELLTRLGPDQALIYGIPNGNEGRVFSRGAFEAAGRPRGGMTRTRDRFSWPAGPGVMMIDHDPHGEARLSRDELIALLEEAAPGLAEADLLWWPSASSHICDRVTGEDLTGLRGQRIYLSVADASDIPRAGQALVDRLWAAGHGRIEVSAAGAALERCPVDACVWQPERLDLAAGADCAEGLEQRRGQPAMRSGHVRTVDTRTVLPDMPEVAREAERRRREARLAVRPDLDSTRDAYCEQRADAMLSESDRADPEKRAAALSVARRAVDHGVLGADWPVEIEVRPGVYESRTVSEILGDRSRYQGALTRDPLESGYDGGRAVGKLFLLDATPALFSFAHGGRTFRLIRAPHTVELASGRTADAVDATLRLLGQDPGVFEFGGRIAVVEGTRIEPLDEHALAHHLGGIIQFWRRKGTAGSEAEPVDPPMPLVRQVLGLGRRRDLAPLAGVVTAPTLRVDGSVLDRPGYDPQSRLLYDPGGSTPPRVPQTPTREEARDALALLMRPFESFPFVSPHARGACLAALLTAVVRPSLPTAPAFAVDAPVQGSGKTLLASCVAALATGHLPEIWPHTGGRDDEEVRKRLFAALQGGTAALVWDNVVGVMDSPALAAALTAPVYTDRILGRSERASVPNRALVLITGNNLCLAGDLPRRVILCRIDPETATPFSRRFDLDPLPWVLSNRLEMSVAALTLLRAGACADGPRAEGRMASFETWDDLVRQTVCWIERVLAPGEFGDPMDLVRESQASDPEQEALAALLGALDAMFGNRWFTAREVQKRAEASGMASENEALLAEALVDVGGERCVTSSRSLGRVLSFRSDRLADGLRLTSRAGGKALEFRIDRVEDGGNLRFDRFNRFKSNPSRGNEEDHTRGKGPETNRSNRPNRNGPPPQDREDVA